MTLHECLAAVQKPSRTAADANAMPAPPKVPTSKWAKPPRQSNNEAPLHCACIPTFCTESLETNQTPIGFAGQSSIRSLESSIAAEASQGRDGREGQQVEQAEQDSAEEGARLVVRIPRFRCVLVFAIKSLVIVTRTYVCPTKIKQQPKARNSKKDREAKKDPRDCPLLCLCW